MNKTGDELNVWQGPPQKEVAAQRKTSGLFQLKFLCKGVDIELRRPDGLTSFHIALNFHVDPPFSQI
jgi:hypothetical protein